MSHNNILLQNSLRWSALPQASNPMHTAWNIFQGKKMPCASCLSANLQWLPLLPNTTLTRIRWIWTYFSDFISLPHHPKLYSAALNVFGAFKLQRGDIHSTKTDNRWGWRDGHLVLYPLTDSHLHNSIPCALQYPIPIHTLHQVSSRYSQSKS